MNLYETDYAGWAGQQASLLRSGQFSLLDTEQVAAELDCIMGNERRELFRHLRVLLAHLLKWQLQPEKRSRSWEASIDVHRTDIAQLLKESPSLKPIVGDKIKEAYPKAVKIAYAETGLPKSIFPEICPYQQDEILDENFWPD